MRKTAVAIEATIVFVSLVLLDLVYGWLSGFAWFTGYEWLIAVALVCIIVVLGRGSIVIVKRRCGTSSDNAIMADAGQLSEESAFEATGKSQVSALGESSTDDSE